MQVIAMRGWQRSRCAFAVVAMVAMVSSSVQAQSPDSKSDPASFSAADRHFTLRVLPVLREKCWGCHGADQADLKGDYDVRTRESLIVGGESGEPAIVSGNALESRFYQAVIWDGLEMPPKENDRLSDDQCQAIREWIEAGTVWPDAETQRQIQTAEQAVAENEDGVLVSTSGGLADAWTFRRYQRETIWAFLPRQTEFDHDSVDGFIDQKLRVAGIEGAARAEPLELLRRATFDLTGLPPTTEQTQAFLAASIRDADAAWSDLIDRLLASPHYGERWAQHWLDVVRYSDTGGFSNDYERSNAWRYRDFVIRWFNDDRPFDEFVVAQIAGDEANPDDAESIVATGFLRMGPWDTAMIPQDEARQIYRDDLVHSIGQTFLSMPMRCCKCHDHKFDPIPTRDYYRMYAAVSTTQPAEVPADFLPNESLDGFDSGRELVETLFAFADGKRQALIDKQESAARAWYEERGLPYKDEKARKDDADDAKPPRYAGLNETEKGRLKVREQDTWIWNRRRERYLPMAQSVFSGPDLWQNAKELRRPEKLNPDWRPESFILTGGDLSAKADAVTPGVLSGCNIPVGSPSAEEAYDNASADDPYALTTEVTGRRLGLARWIARPDNPLTARSYVNRIWQHHFGRGIVATPNNFGVKGDSPSHLELLDYLAEQLIRHGWKTKPLHRMIMMSDAYQRSTRHADMESLALKDPDNLLLARFNPRRLTAEELRDAMLLASGELNRKLGGVPAMPEINREVALEPRMIQFSIAPAYQPSPTPAQRNRRSIYAYRVRGQADPMMQVFNLPNPNESCDLRDDAAVSPQAFTLLNSEYVSDRSIAMALDLERESSDLDLQIEQLFLRAASRRPDDDQRARLVALVNDMTAYHQSVTPEAVTYPTKVVRSLVEEFSGETFEFDERLPVFENYTPDAKPATVSPRTRALADACRLLLNTNEFIYAY